MNAGRDPLRVAVRGEEPSLRGAVVAAVEATDGATLVDGTGPGGTGADVLVAAGEAALRSLAADPPEVAVLPVEAGTGRHGIDRAGLAPVLASVGGDVRTAPHPVLSAAVDGDTVARAVLDVSLVAGQPARISEFGVSVEGEAVDAVRADGVAVATPAGSAGYARAAGGPVLGPGTGVAVVPVAPFATRSDAWVFRPPVTLSVERDESPVVLVADAEAVCEVGHGAAVRVDEAGTVELLRAPGPGAAWRDGDGGGGSDPPGHQTEKL